MHTIQRMQQEYAQMEAQYNPLIEGEQAEIENLATLKDLSIETQEVCAGMAASNPASPPGIVEAIAATELPTMSSGGSTGSESALSAESISCNRGHYLFSMMGFNSLP